MSPALLLHEVIQLRRPITGMLWSSNRYLLLASLTPDIVASR
jgi:hypothetical protein